MATILRTGKFLRYFAGITRNVVVNSVRDTESSSLLQNKTCMCTQFQNRFTSEAATSKHDFPLDRQIKRLDKDVRRTGRISRRDLEDVLEEIRVTRSATSTQSLLVIRCCGNLVPEEMPEVRTALVQEIWKTLNTLNVPMDISHYNALLRVYLENEHLFSPTDFLAEIESKSIEPNRVTYQRLIARYCQQGDIDGATRILEHMREKNLPVNEAVFNALILGHSQANDMESAKGILGVMNQAGLEPSAETYTTLLCCFGRHGDIESINATLAECEQKEILLLDKDILDVIYHLTVHGHGDKIDGLLGKFHLSTGFNQDCVNTILRLTNKGFEDICMKLLRIMPRGARPDGTPIDVGMFFIKQLVKANRPMEKILSICKTLKDEGLNSKAVLMATEAGLSNGLVNTTLPLLNEMKNIGLPIRQHYFWPLICSVEHNEILDILRKMQQEFHLAPNAETIREYVIPNLKEKNWDKIISALRDAGVPNSTAASAASYTALSNGRLQEASKIMEEYNAIYSFYIFRQPLLQAFGKNENYGAFVSCIRQLFDSELRRVNQSKTDTAAIVTENSEQVKEPAETAAETEDDVTRTQHDVVGELLHDVTSYFRNENITVLEKLLPKLVEEGFTISSHNAEKISDKIGSKMTSTISKLLGKLSSGELELRALNNNGKKRSADTLTVEELERYIVNVEAKGDNSNNLKRHLLAASFRTKNIEKILQVMERLESEKFVLNSGTFAQLIDLYTNLGRVSDAIAAYENTKEKNPDFILDNFKTLNIVELLFNEERVEEGLKFLEKNKKPENFADGEHNYNYISKVWRILNSIAETGDADKLQKIFDAFVQGNYVTPNNVLLGALVKVHLVNDNIPKAIETFEKICLQYKSTPWKNELARRLIEAEDAANLQKVTDLSTNIHGEINSLYDLVFAFVECGRVRQARKILETPGLRTRPHRIESACERYEKEGLIEPLEGLIEATRDLSHIDRNNIYFSLLQSYEKSNDAEKALGLWTKMQEENVTPSDAFLIQLAEILESNNMAVPFVVPGASEQNGKIHKIKSASKPAEVKKEKVTKETVSVQSTQSKTGSNLSLLRKSLQNNDLDAAINYKNNLKTSEQASITDISHLIEQLVKANRFTEATTYLNELLASNLFPIPKIFKFYLNRVANTGDVETLKSIGDQLNEEQKRIVSFDNRYCHAYIMADKVEEYLNNLSDDINNAKTPEEVTKLAEKFPRGGALGILSKHPELADKFEQLAEIYAKHNHLGPINVLWIHHISNGNEDVSKKIWEKHLSSAPRLMFQRVFQTAREQNDVKLVETVINQIKDSKISEGAIGNAYSCLIDIQTSKGKSDKALEAVHAAVKDICLEHINRTALLRLKSALEAEKKEFPYTIPEKKVNLVKGDSSSSSSQSSDDDVTPKRPETKPTKPTQNTE